MSKEKLTDLETFHRKFGVDARRQTAECIEYRVRDLDGMIAAARSVISIYRLALEVRVTGNMAQIRAFEVVPRKEKSND